MIDVLGTGKDQSDIFLERKRTTESHKIEIRIREIEFIFQMKSRSSLQMEVLFKFLKRWKLRLIMNHCFSRRCRSHSVVSLKYLLYFSIFYLISRTFGLNDYLWWEKSFVDEYHLAMTPIDVTKINDETSEKIYGSPKYVISTRFVLNNEYLCSQWKSEGVGQVRLLILVKSAAKNRKAREAIRLTWAKKQFLQKNNVRVAFVLGQFRSKIGFFISE